MAFIDTIRILLGRGRDNREPLDPEEWKRVAARTAWTRETLAKLHAAQEEMDKRCMAAVEILDEEAFERLCDEEQAKVDAIRALVDDVIERDKWPRELYFGGI